MAKSVELEIILSQVNFSLVRMPEDMVYKARYGVILDKIAAWDFGNRGDRSESQNREQLYCGDSSCFLVLRRFMNHC